MDRARAEMILTDVLAGECSIQNLDELSEYEVGNSDFKEYRENLETVWGLGSGEAFNTSAGNEIFREKINRIVGKVTGLSRRGARLSMDSLDQLSAAGPSLLGDEHDLDKE